MSTSIGILGGADGPTAIYVTGSIGWLRYFGLMIVVLLLIPNVIYAIRHRGAGNKCNNKLMNLLEQIGRYGCMLLMVIHTGPLELGFFSPEAFAVYLIGSLVLLLAYWVCWIVYGKKPGRGLAVTLAVLPPLIFLLSGLTLGHWLLTAFALLFGVAHVFVTLANENEPPENGKPA